MDIILGNDFRVPKTKISREKADKHQGYIWFLKSLREKKKRKKKKIERKNRWKEKVKKIYKKIDLKSINYFYILL